MVQIVMRVVHQVLMTGVVILIRLYYFSSPLLNVEF